MELQLLNDYGIFILIIIFLIFNIYYSNKMNILVLIVTYLVINRISDSKTAFLFSYIISISYGIIKNFHLLENFQNIIYKKKPINLKTTINNKNVSLDNIKKKKLLIQKKIERIKKKIERIKRKIEIIKIKNIKRKIMNLKINILI